MNTKMKKQMDDSEYEFFSKNSRYHTPGKVYQAGFEARDRIAQEREAKLVHGLESLIERSPENTFYYIEAIKLLLKEYRAENGDDSNNCICGEINARHCQVHQEAE